MIILHHHSLVAFRQYGIVPNCFHTKSSFNGMQLLYHRSLFLFQLKYKILASCPNHPLHHRLGALVAAKTSLLQVSKPNFDRLMDEIPGSKDQQIDLLHQHINHYHTLFLSRIRDSPEIRYANLLKEYPHIIQRIPLQYIASDLGISSISLSRIRNRIT